MTSPLGPKEFAELERLFHEALALPPRAREEFVARLGETDPVRAGGLAALLAADGGDETLRRIVSAEAQATVPAGDPFVGARFGAYRLERVIGRGGMGTVYLGRRDDETFEQEVAVKTLPSGLTTPGVLDRFRREREILARLNHPGIARLLDGGAGPQGVPYVVMEFIAGVPLTRFATDTRATLRERLELFLQLSDAVEFVHRNLVVHRDIKPGNVLVTSEGRVKLLDFGIARLADEVDARSAPTATGQRAMTPEYASPEQILGQPVTTSADIYALGVLLYELLTGDRPVKSDSTNPFELAQEIVSKTPVPPSEAAAGSTAKDRAPRFARQLRGDLDRIVMMAMRKEPDRRYVSVSALAADVRAWLAGRPVAAQTDTWRYRARKLVGRHPVASAAALVVAATVTAFTMLTVRQGRIIADERDRAVTAARRATATSDFLVRLFQAADPRQAGTRNMTAFDLLEAGVANLGADRTLDAEVRADLYLTLGLSLANLEAFEPGINSLRAAVAESERASGRDSLETAERLHRLGDVLRRVNRFDDALANLTEALEIRRRHLPGDNADIADSYNNLAILAVQVGEYVESDRLQTESVAMHGRLKADRGVPINNLALLRRRQGRYEEALNLATRAHALLVTTDDRDSARLAQLNIASVRKAMGDVDGAQALYESVLGPAREELGLDHSRVVSIDLDIARCLLAKGEYDRVRRMYGELEPRIRNAFGAESVLAAVLLRDQGLVDLAQNRPAAAERKLRQALDLHLRVSSPVHFRVPSFRRALAEALIETGKLGEAEQHLRLTIALFPDSKVYPHMEVALTLMTLSRTLHAASRDDDATAALAEARDIIERTAGDQSLEMKRLRTELKVFEGTAPGGGHPLP